MSWHPFDELLSNRCELRLDSCLRWRHWSVRSMGFHSFFVTSILCGDRQITAKITAHTKTNKNAKTWHRTLLIWWCSIYSLTDSNACPCLSRAKSKRDLQRKNANKMYYLMEISMEHHVLIRTFFHVFRCELTTFWWKISAMENWFGWARRWNSLIKYPLICVAVQIDCERLWWCWIIRRHSNESFTNGASVIGNSFSCASCLVMLCWSSHFVTRCPHSDLAWTKLS